MAAFGGVRTSTGLNGRMGNRGKNQFEIRKSYPLQSYVNLNENEMEGGGGKEKRETINLKHKRQMRKNKSNEPNMLNQ